MHELLVIGFWVGLMTPIAVYVGYPAFVLALSRLTKGRRFAIDPTSPWPSVTVAIAVHNEERDIARAIRSVLAEDYPGQLSVLAGLDGCTDGTRSVVEGFSDRRVGFLDLARQGKAATDNSIVAAASSDVIVTTAAGGELEPGTLRRLVGPFRDPLVGCTTGRFAPRQDGTIATGGSGLYWRMEYLIMAAESKLGLLAAASGTCMAHRRSVFRPIPEDSDGDVFIAPNAILQGARVVFVSDAIVHDDGPAKMETVLRSQRRMALRAIPATCGVTVRLLRRHPNVAFALVMHKLLRWFAPFFGILWAISAIGLIAAGDSAYTVVTAALLGVGAVAAVAASVVAPRLRGAVISFGLVQVAFVLATIDVVRGRRARMWNRA